MIYLTTTTLNKEVKKNLLAGNYNDEQARAVYAAFRALKAKRQVGFHRAAIIVAVVFVLMTVLSLIHPVPGISMSAVLVITVANGIVLAGTVFLVYYLVLGRFKQQLHQAMGVHYAHILQEEVG